VSYTEVITVPVQRVVLRWYLTWCSYYPRVIIRVLDRSLDELQHGMETPHRREPQRMLGYARLVGELYNFQVISAQLIFELLYRLINFGHLLPSSAQNLSAQPQTPGKEVLVGLERCPPLKQFQSQPQRCYDPTVPSDFDPPTGLHSRYRCLFTN
jgi:hypothetical protein